ncbi:hypothetical protein MIND_01348800 [Mycena indigotica]|uniref:DUF6533 domain-containing protein n=1 Tax=Mycena indigotica TaxID=2126181 RepID=A0A8H6S0Q0_9AGAR|nr:uncharacterized protein MIND_01348800 [Mycena indigotica]KAF7289752.1 hypothetical protein MIND_01348800 [Mycena indigotica]
MALPDMSQIVGALQDIETTRFAQLASSAIIIFDHVITLDEEVELIWRSSWSMGKILFIINRYYTLFSVVLNNYSLFSASLTDSVRLNFLRWQGWTGMVTAVIAEVILQMRLYALYYQDKKVLALMSTLFVLSLAASAAIMGTVLGGLSAISHLPGTGVTFCIPIGTPQYFFVYWIPMLFFESLLCVLALYRGLRTFRASVSLYQSGRHLVTILIRDSVLYFIVMFASYLTNLMVWLLARQTLLEVPIAFSVALSCVLCNRIVLNVREVKGELDSTAEAVVRNPNRLTFGNDSVGSGSVKSVDSHMYDAEYAPRPNSATPLTTIEMAQLRSMRVDGQYLQQLESGVYERDETSESGRTHGQFVVL